MDVITDTACSSDTMKSNTHVFGLYAVQIQHTQLQSSPSSHWSTWAPQHAQQSSHSTPYITHQRLHVGAPVDLQHLPCDVVGPGACQHQYRARCLICCAHTRQWYCRHSQVPQRICTWDTKLHLQPQAPWTCFCLTMFLHTDHGLKLHTGGTTCSAHSITPFFPSSLPKAFQLHKAS